MFKHDGKLRSFLRRRLVKAGLVGLFMWGLSFGLFYYLVFQQDTNKFWTSVLLSPCMTAVGLVLNRLLAWGDRKAPKKQYVKRWSMKWAVMFTIGQSSFMLLAGTFGLPALRVRAGSALPLSYISYKLSNQWVFREQEETEKA